MAVDPATLKLAIKAAATIRNKAYQQLKEILEANGYEAKSFFTESRP